MNQLARRYRVAAVADATRVLQALSAGRKSICHLANTTATTTTTTIIVDNRKRIQQSRSYTTSNSGSKPSSFQLPDPTWSLQELELSKQHAPISDTELQTLAKRALLDLTSLDEKLTTTTTASSTTTREQLRQDLGNMMHMIEQVQSFDFDKMDANNNDTKSLLEDQASIYDTPRGVVAAPLRPDNNNDDSEESIVEAEENQKEAKRVFESFLQPQTTKVGAHNYFSIETKTQTSG